MWSEDHVEAKGASAAQIHSFSQIENYNFNVMIIRYSEVTNNC